MLYLHIHTQAYLKVIPVRFKSGIVLIRSESELAEDMLKNMEIEYPEKVVDGAQTK